MLLCVKKALIKLCSGNFADAAERSEHIESVIKSGVMRSISIEVPEIPLSYRLTGDRKTVMPKAFTIPVIVSKMKFLILRDDRTFFITAPSFVIFCLHYLL